MPISTDDRIYKKLVTDKLDRIVILDGAPANHDGGEGDIQVRSLKTGLRLYVKYKNKWQSVALSEHPLVLNNRGFVTSENVVHSSKFYYDMKVCNFSAASGTVFMLPLLSYAEKTSFTGDNEYISIVAPYTGYLVRAAFRSEEAQNGNLIFKLYGSTTGTEVPASVRATKTTAINISDDTSVIVDLDSGLDSGSNLMVKGDIFGVEITVPAAPGDCNVTLTFKWDIAS